MGDERWTVLLASWMMAFGCLRCTHITRSEPRQLTAAFLHCRCQKGKQKQTPEMALTMRSLPAPTDSSGQRRFWNVLEAHWTLAPARQRVSGLCFSDEGRPWTILEAQESMQNEMAVLLDNPEEITTYSWRRMAPTLAQLLECRPEEMAALGDWQNKGDQPDVGQMAFHYSSAKYAASIKIKSFVWGAGGVGAGQNPRASRVRAVASPGPSAYLGIFAEVPGCAQAPPEALSAIRGSGKARQEAEAGASPQMPDQLGGKVLTATLKNGKALCPEFLADECPNPADDCPFGAHLCAVLQQSGRACGGKQERHGRSYLGACSLG